jgi:hypothetical protein
MKLENFNPRLDNPLWLFILNKPNVKNCHMNRIIEATNFILKTTFVTNKSSFLCLCI